jgi:hypothetical protein
MKVSWFLFFLILLCSLINVKNYVQSIAGSVSDKDSKETLIGASVVLVGSNPLVGTTTDVNGNFLLKNVPVGRQSFLVSYIGYSEMIVSEILVTTG